MPKAPKFKEVKDVAGGNSSISRLKKKIRDIERLLKRTEITRVSADDKSQGRTGDRNGIKNTTARARQEQERALKALKEELREAEQMEKSKRMEHKYHKVRFFERRKAVRKVEKARRALVDDDKSSKERSIKENALRLAEIELAYIALFPRESRYISLYADGGAALKAIIANDGAAPNSDIDKTISKRKEWWQKVKMMVERGDVVVDSLMFGNGGKDSQAVEKRLRARSTLKQNETDGAYAQDEIKQSEDSGSINEESDEFFE
ncbi:hypothetical protein V1511DRAFT_498943 [Dipodascopsis uninucleata]